MSGNWRGWRTSAFERDVPPSTSVRIDAISSRTLCFSLCSTITVSASETGNCAPSRDASCRVITASSVCDSRRLSDSPPARAPTSVMTGSTDSGISPRPRNSWRARRALSASKTPVDSLPTLSTAANLNAAMRRLLARDAQRFFLRRDAGLDPALRIGAHVDHSIFFRDAAHIGVVRPLMHQHANFIVDGEQLVDAGATQIAGVTAVAAADRPPSADGCVGLLAMRA